LRAASPTHLRGVSDYAVGRLDENELDAFRGMLGRMLRDEEPGQP
jgi:hypothetical protein